jgi:NAD(P)-dependent dehydrogenase (short-subunit alcohol dehydrogenase family)
VGNAPETYSADLSDLGEVHALAAAIREKHGALDVVINNAGVLKTKKTVTAEGYDMRFMVNTFAPYLLTKELLPIIAKGGRVVNLSSAAQASVDLEALHGRKRLSDMDAYAQSKLAITLWTSEFAKQFPDGPLFVAVNPGSLLASKMVKEGFGVAGNDLNIGADILREAALGQSFANANGKYFDNDSGAFANPHSAALDAGHSAKVMQAITDAVSALS